MVSGVCCTSAGAKIEEYGNPVIDGQELIEIQFSTRWTRIIKGEYFPFTGLR